MNIFTFIAKHFIGSGIGRRFPRLHALYKKLFVLTAKKNAIQQFNLPHGLKLAVPTGDTGPGLYLASTGVYEPYETKLFLNETHQGDTVLDIGAHVGYYTVLLGHRVVKKGKVIAVEPVAANASLLKKNIETNKLQNCTVIKKAVSDKNGWADIFLSSASSGDHSLIQNTHGRATRVPVTSVDAIAKKLRIAPSIIKIDVEGAEQQVLSGMKNVLKNNVLRTLFIEVSQGPQSIKIVETLMQSGFTVRIIDEQHKLLWPYTQKKAEQILASHGYMNLLAKRSV